MKHKLYTIEYDDLLNQIKINIDKGYIKEVVGPNNLILYNYTDSCQYDKAWDLSTMVSRGLVIDRINKKIVGFGFEKFFNLSELGPEHKLPELPYTITEKVDGSLIISFNHNAMWYSCTRGSFNSDQSLFANNILSSHNIIKDLNSDYIYLWESVYPTNKIVVDYNGWSGLVLLGIFNKITGEELDYELVTQEYHRLCLYNGDSVIRLVHIYPYLSIEKIINLSKESGKNIEGWVVRYQNGFRVKIKTDEYIKIHKCKFGLTPLVVWDLLINDCDLDDYRKNLPEELWVDFDNIVNNLTSCANTIYSYHLNLYKTIYYVSRKDFAMKVNCINDKNIFKFLLFSFYDNLTPHQIKKIILQKCLKPVANILKEMHYENFNS
jgi:RNA ligase